MAADLVDLCMSCSALISGSKGFHTLNLALPHGSAVTSFIDFIHSMSSMCVFGLRNTDPALWSRPSTDILISVSMIYASFFESSSFETFRAACMPNSAM